MICRDCRQEFTVTSNKPGFINQCEECATDVPQYKAEQGTDDSGVVETMTKGRRVKSVSGLFGGEL